MELQPYEHRDCPALARLFFETVRTVNRRDYSRAQVEAWAPEVPDLAAWDAALSACHTLVAVEGGEIVGFADMDSDGYLDRLYVHRAHQGRGIASALCNALEEACSAGRFTTYASLTARPFFEGRGYRVVKAQQVERRGVLLPNFKMEKHP